MSTSRLVILVDRARLVSFFQLTTFNDDVARQRVYMYNIILTTSDSISFNSSFHNFTFFLLLFFVRYCMELIYDKMAIVAVMTM